MTFRARLTLFFLAVVGAPLVAGAFMASHISRTQALQDADSRLQVAAVTASNALKQERFAMTRDLSSAAATRAAGTTAPGALDALRRSSRLDYLIVVSEGKVTAASIDVPAGLPRDPAAIEDGALTSVAAERRVIILGAGNGTVLGGRIWRPDVPSALGVRATLVVDGSPVTTVPAPFLPSRQAASAGRDRLVCLCRGGADASGLVLFTPARWDGLAAWVQWPKVGLLALVIVAIGLVAYGLAGLLSRPLMRLAREAEAVARGEQEPRVTVDADSGREFVQVGRTLRSVSAKLSGSRKQLDSARGRLAETERLTLLDPLTGVWNRRYVEQALREQVKRHRRFGSAFALLMIDIDRFKLVNDHHGHPAGDAVLLGVASALGHSIRADLDVLARLGGEEFVVVLPETDTLGGAVAAEKLRNLVSRTTFDFEGAAISITVSVGVAACPEDGVDALRLMAAADAALYRAKESGRNRTMTASTPKSSAREA
ncbi:MAG: GGDEF domain-containing protein [Actinomycetota bacterium]